MNTENISLGGVNLIEGNAVEVPTHDVVNEKIAHDRDGIIASKGDGLEYDIQAAPTLSDGDEREKDSDNEDTIIVTGFDAAQHLLPLRDDFEPALTFRSIFLASCLASFQAVMSQIYSASIIDISSSCQYRLTYWPSVQTDSN